MMKEIHTVEEALQLTGKNNTNLFINLVLNGKNIYIYNTRERCWHFSSHITDDNGASIVGRHYRRTKYGLCPAAGQM